MRNRILLACVILSFLMSIGCAQRPTPHFAPQNVIDNVYRHIVSIAVYYYMSPEEFGKRIWQNPLAPKIPLDTDETYDGKPVKVLAYLGSGTILRDNHVITVRHLFDSTANIYGRRIWVFVQHIDHAIECDLVAITEKQEGDEDDYFNDYALIQMKEDVGLPGISISKRNAELGEKIMFGCSVGGTAYFLRFGHTIKFKWYFRKDDRGRLHLSRWRDYHFTTATPSGPGDSGSGIFNMNGELVGMIYLGTELYSQLYGFSNPIEMLWDFLEKYHLDYLGYLSSD